MPLAFTAAEKSVTVQTNKQKKQKHSKLEMWVNAQRDGRPAEYRWRICSTPQIWLTLTVHDAKAVEITWGAPNW